MLSGSYTPDTAGRRLRSKILDTVQFPLATIARGGQDFATYQPSPPYPQAPTQYMPGPLAAKPGGSPAPDKFSWS
jgi:hypothetical protein